MIFVKKVLFTKIIIEILFTKKFIINVKKHI